MESYGIAVQSRQLVSVTIPPWLKAELATIVARLPLLTLEEATAHATHASWEQWREGLTRKATLLTDLPPLRVLLIVDNLAGHHTPAWLCWCFAQGILPLFTPLGGSWLNMAESIQRILSRRALAGHHLTSAQEVMDWLATTVRGWNTAPTPFVWEVNANSAAGGRASGGTPSMHPIPSAAPPPRRTGLSPAALGDPPSMNGYARDS